MRTAPKPRVPLCKNVFGPLLFTADQLQGYKLIVHNDIYNKQLLFLSLSYLDMFLKWLTYFLKSQKKNNFIVFKNETGMTLHREFLVSSVPRLFSPTSEVLQQISPFHALSNWYSDQLVMVLILKLAVQAGLTLNCACASLQTGIQV